MDLLERERAATPAPRAPVPLSDVDLALTAQLVVAWAGETGEDPRRLGWWRSDLTSEFGGQDLFKRLLPHTWPWATLQAAREAARRTDAAARRHDHDPDRVISLFHLGFDLDERLEERLADLKRADAPPHTALPGLTLTNTPWSPTRFFEWVTNHGPPTASPSPVGRRLPGPPPDALDALVQKLVAALAPPADHYPLPHFKKAP